jgi:hypothetical protein
MKYNPKIVVAWFAEHGLYPVAEHRFHPDRRWRFDWAFSPYAKKVALEVQGGLFVNGRHSRGPALLKEHEKLNEAAALGWRVLFTTPDNLCMQETVDLIKRALEV